MIKSKLKEKQLIISDYQWHDLYLIGQLNQNDTKEITNDTSICIFFQGVYYGIDLFDVITHRDEQIFQDWDLKLKLNGLQYLLIKINSIRDKYKIAFFGKNMN